MSIPAAYFGVVLIWSTTPLAIAWSSSGVDFMVGVTGRMSISLVLAWTLVWLLRMKMDTSWRGIQVYLAAALAVYGAMMSVYWGAQFIPSGWVSVIYGLSPVITGVIAALWLKERFGPRQLLGALLGVAGLLIMFADNLEWGGHALMGVLATLLAAVLQAFSAVWMKRIGSNMSPLAMVTGSLTIAVPLYYLTAWTMGVQWPVTIGQRTLFTIVYLGVFGSVLGFVLYFYVLKHMQAGKVSLISLMTPVNALLLGYYLNHEPLSWTIAAGVMVTLFGLWVYLFGWTFIPLRRKVSEKTLIAEQERL